MAPALREAAPVVGRLLRPVGRREGGVARGHPGAPNSSAPVTTDPERIAAFVAAERPATKVIFSTYQSIHQVNAARLGDAPIQFDLAVADEAHRTTGAKKAGTAPDQSKIDFQAFHDADRLHTRKRLYMTATPRVYHARSKAAAEKRHYTVTDMADEDVYGPQLHRLPFKTAVEAGMLSDYRVIVLGVHEGALTDGIRKLKGDQGKVDELLRVMGVSLAVNGLARGGTAERAPGRLNRTLAFANTINRSEWYAETLTNELVKARTTREIRREHGRAEASTSIETVHPGRVIVRQRAEVRTRQATGLGRSRSGDRLPNHLQLPTVQRGRRRPQPHERRIPGRQEEPDRRRAGRGSGDAEGRGQGPWVRRRACRSRRR